MRYLLPLLFLAFGQAAVFAQDLLEFELNHRIDLTVDRLLDLNRQPAFTEDFLLADVRIDPANPRRFDNFSGDLSGRYVEVVSTLPAAVRERAGLDDLVKKIISFQQPDGRFGDPALSYTAEEIGGEHMALLWGNGRLLVGLTTYLRTHPDADVLSAARKLGDFFIATAAACREPAIVQRLEGFGAKGIICFTQYIEGLSLLAELTGEQKYVRAARDAYTIMPERGIQHSHGYLSTLRGVLLLHGITDDPGLLDYVRKTFDDLLASRDYNRFYSVYEYYGMHTEEGTKHALRDEGCSSADFVRLAFHLHEVTGDDRYLTVAEKALYNGLYYNQYAGGDYGHHFFGDGVIRASNSRRSWWCCTMHGLRALIDVRDRFALTNSGNTIRLHLLSSMTTSADGARLEVRQLPAEDEYERFRITVINWPQGKRLEIPLPNYAHEMRVSHGAMNLEVASDGEVAWIPIEEAGPGSILDVSLRFRRAFHRADGSGTLAFPTSPSPGYLTYGPHLMGINQENFTAEPDWGHQASLRDLKPGEDPNTLVTNFRAGGYPGTHPTTLVPVARQMYFGHPYMRLNTQYGLDLTAIPDKE